MSVRQRTCAGSSGCIWASEVPITPGCMNRSGRTAQRPHPQQLLARSERGLDVYDVRVPSTGSIALPAPMSTETEGSDARENAVQEVQITPDGRIRRRIAPREGRFTGEHAMRSMEAERPICLELFFAKELVARAFVREEREPRFVAHDVVVLVAGERRFKVDQEA